MDQRQYMDDAERTASSRFYGERTTQAEFRKRLYEFSQAAESLDKVKKLTFYGKGEDIGLTASAGSVGLDEAKRKLAVKIASPLELPPTGNDLHDAERIIHAVLGILTEAGELAEWLLKITNGGEFDRINGLEEGGDILWYLAMLFRALDSDFSGEFGRNIAKLKLRFPDRFSEHNAIHRNLEGERGVLEAGASTPGRLKLTPPDDTPQSVGNELTGGQNFD